VFSDTCNGSTIICGSGGCIVRNGEATSSYIFSSLFVIVEEMGIVTSSTVHFDLQ
jgi:hypothetical protein